MRQNLVCGSVVFWQIDTLGKVRTGKVMNYNSETGKRSNGITWGSVALIRKGCIFNRESDFKKLAHRKF